ncbi:hypothetical protein HanOQP8_Chr16g0632041 [Helianthus annuus]|nr:hypothetical protein HanHA89_Chr16g0677391 [Helianthus annuus]KAJ0646158.1 hypothetical protein HanOQP8_Chr16g0632041 [Helianthus annuus]KAJ0822809.1 hypothetical protein HanPSC8_Chr16g0736401 [Helianthus annuus]
MHIIKNLRSWLPKRQELNEKARHFQFVRLSQREGQETSKFLTWFPTRLVIGQGYRWWCRLPAKNRYSKDRVKTHTSSRETGVSCL